MFDDEAVEAVESENEVWDVGQFPDAWVKRYEFAKYVYMEWCPSHFPREFMEFLRLLFDAEESL